ncbi:MAG: class I SAM-dependent methyltransferase [Chloroflexi bacterium]|nr:class I SAM-dependent methyltransferase [Chloroflexota bacterium]
MKALELAPSRYDRGISLIALGRVSQVYDSLVLRINDGWKVLDIGCGTGAMTLRAAQRGAVLVSLASTIGDKG